MDISMNVLWVQHCFEQNWPEGLRFGGRPGRAALAASCPEEIPRRVRAWLPPQTSSDSGLAGWTPEVRDAGDTVSRAPDLVSSCCWTKGHGWESDPRSVLSVLGVGGQLHVFERAENQESSLYQQTPGTSPSFDWIHNFKVCHGCILLCLAIFRKPWNGCFKSGHMCEKCRNYSFPLLPPALTHGAMAEVMEKNS